MIRILVGIVLLLGTGTLRAEIQEWRSTSGHKIQAEFVRLQGVMLTLKREDGQPVTLPLNRLLPEHQALARKLAAAETSAQPQTISKPTGRRELVWNRIEGAYEWPKAIRKEERDVLDQMSDKWRHSRTRYFTVHYLKETYARKVGRQADFFYEFIASDLSGMKDLFQGVPSHIVIVGDQKEWEDFLIRSECPLQWASAFVYGNVMMMQDFGSKTGAELLSHEVTHLVMNRFFMKRPPLWLNEGLAEWYGAMGWKAFKGQLYSAKRSFRDRENDPILLPQLFELRAYPTDVARFYETSRFLVGFLMLKEDTPTFVEFLSLIVVEGVDVLDAATRVYGFADINDWHAQFNEFLE